MKNAAFLTFALSSFALLGGCNTVNGLGKDVEAVGQGVSHMATEVQDEWFGNYGQPERAGHTGVAQVGQPCDPDAELDGGNGLPPCPRILLN